MRESFEREPKGLETKGEIRLTSEEEKFIEKLIERKEMIGKEENELDKIKAEIEKMKEGLEESKTYEERKKLAREIKPGKEIYDQLAKKNRQ